MDTRNLLQARARGAANPLFIAILVVFVLFAAGAWLLIVKPYQAQLRADSTGRPTVPVAAAAQTSAPPPADVAVMDIDQLLSEARKAINDQRYLAPAGNNAFELYLRVLEKQPGNQVASEALREIFPFASNSAEQAINASNFNDAQRQIDLLAKADPNNFTLTILRSKLDAQRKLLNKQQQQTLNQQKAQELAAKKATSNRIVDAQAATGTEQHDQATLAARQAQSATQTAQPTSNEPVKPSAATTRRARVLSGETRPSSLISQSLPKYPPEAMRAQRSGWVVIGFTVEPDGHTGDVKVLDAQPRHVFDRSAIDAVKRYQFKPALRNGSAVSSKRQQRIEFKL